METKSFGRLKDGREAALFIMINESGAGVAVTNVGASIVSIAVPDRAGKLGDVVLGYGAAEPYTSKGAYHGATVGRVANRIEDARFTLNGREYQLKPNMDGGHFLHGGEFGLDTKLFSAEITADDTVRMTTVSPDGEDGFPGNLTVTVTYRFDRKNRLHIEHSAVSDADTPVNLTNHAYFNLSGQGVGTIENHELQIFSDYYYPLGANGMVTGETAPVDGVMDFRVSKRIGEDIARDDAQLAIAGGYDHNYFLQNGADMMLAARAYDPESGRVMRVYTDMPGILFYSGNALEGAPTVGKCGRAYRKREGFCLESNFCPNALRFPQLKQPILRAGERYLHKTVYEFDVE